jgi:hypothetical protein
MNTRNIPADLCVSSYVEFSTLTVCWAKRSTKWHFVVSCYNETSSACGVYCLLANRDTAINGAVLWIHDILIRVSESKSATVEVLYCLLSIVVRDKKCHGFLLRRESFYFAVQNARSVS